MEFIKQIIEFLNSCAGLLSLLAVLAAIIVPTIIYKKQRHSEKQDLQDELDAMNEVSRHSFDANQHIIECGKVMWWCAGGGSVGCRV